MAKRNIAIYGLPFLVGMGVVVWLAFNLDAHTQGRDFMHNGWIPAKLILEGQNPYAPDQTRVRVLAGDYFGTLLDESGKNYNTGPNYNAIYPYWALLLQVPLGLLNFPTALIVWTLISGAALLAGVLIGLRASQQVLQLDFTVQAQLAMGLVAVAISLVFMPSLLHIFLGQYSMMVMLALAVLWLSGGRVWLSGAAFAFATMKPQLSALPLAMVLLGWLVVARRRVWLALALSLGLYLAPTLFFPYAFSDWFSVNFLVQKQASSQAPVASSWWGMAYHWGRWLGGWWWLLAVVLSLLTLLLLYRPLRHVLRGGDWQQAMPLTIIVTLLVTPYTIAYDQVLLLLPAIWLALRLQGAESRLAMLVRITLLVWATLLPLLLLLALEYTQSNYIKFLQTLSLLGLYYLTEYVLSVDDETAQATEVAT